MGRKDSVHMHALDSHAAHSLVMHHVEWNGEMCECAENAYALAGPVSAPSFLHWTWPWVAKSWRSQKLLGCTSFTCLEIFPAQPFRQRSLLCWPWAVIHKCFQHPVQSKLNVTTSIATRNTQQARCQEYSCNTSRTPLFLIMNMILHQLVWYEHKTAGNRADRGEHSQQLKHLLPLQQLEFRIYKTTKQQMWICGKEKVILWSRGVTWKDFDVGTNTACIRSSTEGSAAGGSEHQSRKNYAWWKLYLKYVLTMSTIDHHFIEHHFCSGASHTWQFLQCIQFISDLLEFGLQRCDLASVVCAINQSDFAKHGTTWLESCKSDRDQFKPLQHGNKCADKEWPQRHAHA